MVDRDGPGSRFPGWARPAERRAAPSDRRSSRAAGDPRLLDLLLNQPLAHLSAVAEALLDGPAELAAFQQRQGMARDGTTLYVADTENHAIRAIDLESGRVSTVAGAGTDWRASLFSRCLFQRGPRYRPWRARRLDTGPPGPPRVLGPGR